jgi:hypothetical protein
VAIAFGFAVAEAAVVVSLAMGSGGAVNLEHAARAARAKAYGKDLIGVAN